MFCWHDFVEHKKHEQCSYSYYKIEEASDENEKCRSVTVTNISLASFLCVIGKQNSPRCDDAKRGVPSGATLFADMIFIEK